MTRLGVLALGLVLQTSAPGLAPKAPAPGPSPTLKPAAVVDCLEARFVDHVAPFNAVRFVSGKQPTFIDAGDACLNLDPDKCPKRTLMDPGKVWLAGIHAGPWVCVTDGTQFGWTRSADLTLGPTPETPVRQWIGSWGATLGEAKFEVAFREDGKTLHVTGTTQWQAGPDSPPHLGDLDSDGVLFRNELRLGEVRCLDREYQDSHDECAQCVARLMYVGGRILVRDNRFCGGMNVNFDGVYERRDNDL